ncbi:MAG: hypothetical protein FJY18_02985 [Bacteroidetes bacterium]|nr:hypothetical protein [Bacteroidota bacterium]
MMPLSLFISALRGRFFLLKMITACLVIYTFAATSSPILGQQAYRIKAECTVKSKTVGSHEAGLIMGTVYYDVRIGRLIFDVKFPEKETWVFVDSVQWTIRNDTLISIKPSSLKPKLSVLHLSLNQQLGGFGLEQSGYTMTSVKTEQGLVISNWSPPAAARKKMGTIALASQERQLKSVIFYHPNGKILRKQFFRKYQKISNVSLPTEVIDEIYNQDKKLFQSTEYKNTVINDQAPDFHYRRDPQYRNLPSGSASPKR